MDATQGWPPDKLKLDGNQMMAELEEIWERHNREPVVRRIWVADGRTLAGIKAAATTRPFDRFDTVMGIPLFVDAEQMPEPGIALADYRTDAQRRADEAAGLTAWQVYRRGLEGAVRAWMPETEG